MDITTILKAVQLVGETTPAARAIYEGFIVITGGADQTTLRDRYAAARSRSESAPSIFKETGVSLKLLCALFYGCSARSSR